MDWSALVGEATAAAPVVVIDNGTALTKMGYAGNEEPTFVIPTAVAEPAGPSSSPSPLGASWHGATQPGGGGVLGDLHFSIGEAALAARARGGWQTVYPVQCGHVVDWDRMERLWQQSIYQYLRVAPEETGFVLTEPPGAPPESREYTAEVMFETFGVRRLHIARQGALALRGSWASADDGSAAAAPASTVDGLGGADTGLVIDSGAGATSVTPVVGGCVLSHAAQQIPLGGRDITDFILAKLRERGEPLESESAMAVAERVKEQHGYICLDPSKECKLYESDPSAHVIHHQAQSVRTGKPIRIAVGRERFLGPELLFHPGLAGVDGMAPLHEAVDAAIWACPIDCRRPLYRNIVLTGGSTLFPHLHQRLQQELQHMLNRRARRGGFTPGDGAGAGMAHEVHVGAPPQRQYAVYRGGSALGASPEFDAVAKTRAQYEEEGPRVMREDGDLFVAAA